MSEPTIATILPAIDAPAAARIIQADGHTVTFAPPSGTAEASLHLDEAARSAMRVPPGALGHAAAPALVIAAAATIAVLRRGRTARRRITARGAAPMAAREMSQDEFMTRYGGGAP